MSRKKALLNEEEERELARNNFLHGSWQCYALADYKMPFCNDDYNNSLLEFIRGFKDFSPEVELLVQPYAYEHLLCTALSISVTPETRAKLLKKRNMKNAPKHHKSRAKDAKRKTSDKRKRRVREEEEEEEDDGLHEIGDGSHDDENLSFLINLKRDLVLKVCVDSSMSILFTSRSMTGWLKRCICRSLGIGNGEQAMNLVASINTDPRNYVQLLSQRGKQSPDDPSSSQAFLEYEHTEALSMRGRLYDCKSRPVGAVTRAIGTCTSDFPVLRDLTVTAHNVPITRVLNIKSDIPPDVLKKCHEKLSEIRISNVTARISSPSLLHLFYNNSHELYTSQEPAQPCFLDDGWLPTEHNCLYMPDTRSRGDIEGGATRTGGGATVAGDADRAEGGASGGESATEGEEPAHGAKKKKKKINATGAIMKLPSFFSRIRASASLNPVIEFQ